MAEPTEDRGQPVVDWLLHEGHRLHHTADLLTALAARLRGAGVPVDRITLGIRQLHPELFTRAYVWTSAAAATEEINREHGIETTDMYRRSPVAPIFDGGGAFRRRLVGPDAQLDYGILPDLAAEGYTDYTMRPIVFSDGRQVAAGFVTKATDGFNAGDMAVLDHVLEAAAPLVEMRQLRRTAEDLLDTYVGHATGERILSGDILRGAGDSIDAVLWFCDIDGFTELSQRLARDDLIALLNAFFDCVVEPVEAEGGEVLKFMGDAMLAIFPIGGRDRRACCRAAIAAAERAIEGVAALNAERPVAGAPPLSFGLALRAGEAMYGNIGAAQRLDFTVIGPDVNLVARLEPLCQKLGVPLVVSAALAACWPEAFVNRGRQRLRGFEAPQEVFTLARFAT